MPGVVLIRRVRPFAHDFKTSAGGILNAGGTDSHLHPGLLPTTLGEEGP